MEKGLIEREVIEVNGDWAMIREVWDTRIDGCPLLVMKRGADGYVTSWPPKLIKDIITVVKEVSHPCPLTLT